MKDMLQLGSNIQNYICATLECCINMRQKCLPESIILGVESQAT